MRKLAARLLLVMAVVCAQANLGAHTSLPAYLELTEISPGSFNVLWRVPAVEGPPPAIYPVLPSHCSAPTDPTEEHAGASVIARGVITCGTAGLHGHVI